MFNRTESFTSLNLTFDLLIAHFCRHCRSVVTDELDVFFQTVVSQIYRFSHFVITLQNACSVFRLKGMRSSFRHTLKCW